ncbi:MAG: hypothetical protein DMG21_03340 [Acidobacteria bacterium]|nr:MAG: hypothetical protein DMG21_03340 [Acidobacteriota bacterium]
MSELILSDITIMGPGYCVIGLEQTNAGSFHSVRPLPQWGYAWREPFRFTRGDYVETQLTPARRPRPPHIEDRQSDGLRATERKLSDARLVEVLSLAEVSSSLEGLFGTDLRFDSPYGNRWVQKGEGARSVCGVCFGNINFSVYKDQEPKLCAQVVLPSNER